jgi:hypothetical protein
MKLNVKNPPRLFEVGFGEKIQMKDCAHIEMEPDEQVTFLTESGAEYDVARKSWGYYATSSLNGRLKSFGLRAVLVKGEDGKFFVHLVEKGKENDYDRYRQAERLVVVCWLDGDEPLLELETKLKSP